MASILPPASSAAPTDIRPAPVPASPAGPIGIRRRTAAGPRGLAGVPPVTAPADGHG
ncbi:hypothetical protein [Streptomyces sp. NPDC088726]|uniref:hypothetical protein n=1 Tax=Streptomyces sp. NPDC088726 TaxID=3365874 RepID=UPI0038162AF6